MRKSGDLNKRTTAIILKTLVESEEPLHVREIIRRTGLCNETVVRVLKTLAERGWLECTQIKNRKYYFLKQNLPLNQALRIFSFIKIDKEEETKKEEVNYLERWLAFCATLSNSFSAFFKMVEGIRQVEERQAQISEVAEKIHKIISQFQKAFDFAVSFFERRKKKIEFLRKEFLQENIDIYEIDVFTTIKLVSWFIKNESGYIELRARGLRPTEALEWAREYKWIKFRKEMKTRPMSEWNGEVRRLLEHPPEVLRNVYGWRLTYKEILGLKD